MSSKPVSYTHLDVYKRQDVVIVPAGLRHVVKDDVLPRDGAAPSGDKQDGRRGRRHGGGGVLADDIHLAGVHAPVHGLAADGDVCLLYTSRCV